MWRIDLRPDAVANRGLLQSGSGQLSGYQPFLLYNGCATSLGNGPCTNIQPIFFEPTIIFMGGSLNPPTLGIAFGTGNRAELARPNSQVPGFYVVIDNGQTAATYIRSGATSSTRIPLRDITPGTGLGPCALPYNPANCTNANGDRAPGFVLDYASVNEKTTSTVYSTLGYLSVVTFTPDSVSPCATNGNSFQYRFFFLTGTGPYGQTGTYADYQTSLGQGIVMRGQSVTAGSSLNTTGSGTNDIFLGAGGYDPTFTPGTVHSVTTNWKEQQ
jgi:Tfp pilus tip-associated adhesin PilY1